MRRVTQKKKNQNTVTKTQKHIVLGLLISSPSDGALRTKIAPHDYNLSFHPVPVQQARDFFISLYRLFHFIFHALRSQQISLRWKFYLGTFVHGDGSISGETGSVLCCLLLLCPVCRWDGTSRNLSVSHASWARIMNGRDRHDWSSGRRIKGGLLKQSNRFRPIDEGHSERLFGRFFIRDVRRVRFRGWYVVRF